mgnify:CR=1 FL=1
MKTHGGGDGWFQWKAVAATAAAPFPSAVASFFSVFLGFSLVKAQKTVSKSILRERKGELLEEIHGYGF